MSTATTDQAVGEDRTRDLVMTELQRELRALRHKYQQLCDFDAALRQVIRSVQSPAPPTAVECEPRPGVTHPPAGPSSPGRAA